MLWLVVTMAGCAEAEEPAKPEAAESALDCSRASDRARCEADAARITQIAAAITALDCSKGRKKKQEACATEKASLELEQAELMARNAPVAEEAAEEEAPLTRGVLGAPPSPADGPDKQGKPVQKMEHDVTDE
ncbi:MAG: hypothetical protein AAGA48_25820 [Myxococcota bacterium]